MCNHGKIIYKADSAFTGYWYCELCGEKVETTYRDLSWTIDGDAKN
jgi:hypothetical protein